jgi:hypothetical protein
MYWSCLAHILGTWRLLKWDVGKTRSAYTWTNKGTGVGGILDLGVETVTAATTQS